MANTDTFLFSDYWPQPQPGVLVVVDYGITANLHLSSIFSYVDGSIWHQDDYTDTKWTATWINNYHYIDSTGKDWGIRELADWYPATSWPQKMFGSIKVTAFTKGYEIFWGGFQKVGDIIDAPIKIDPFKSTFPAWPSTGRQVVKFVGRYDRMTLVDKSATYNDVIEVTYDQTFGKTAGARYWYARGKGIVQMQWRGNAVDVGDILPCKITTLKGYIGKNRYPVLT